MVQSQPGEYSLVAVLGGAQRALEARHAILARSGQGACRGAESKAVKPFPALPRAVFVLLCLSVRLSAAEMSFYPTSVTNESGVHSEGLVFFFERVQARTARVSVEFVQGDKVVTVTQDVATTYHGDRVLHTKLNPEHLEIRSLSITVEGVTFRWIHPKAGEIYDFDLTAA